MNKALIKIKENRKHWHQRWLYYMYQTDNTSMQILCTSMMTYWNLRLGQYEAKNGGQWSVYSHLLKAKKAIIKNHLTTCSVEV